MYSYAKVPINCKGCDLVERFGLVWLLDFMASHLTGNGLSVHTQLSYEARRCNSVVYSITRLVHQKRCWQICAVITSTINFNNLTFSPHYSAMKFHDDRLIDEFHGLQLHKIPKV